MKGKFFPPFAKKDGSHEEREEISEQFLRKKEEIQILSGYAGWMKRLLAHDFRMPMAIISGYGELLRNGAFQNRQEEMDCIDKICRNIEHMDLLFKVVLGEGTEDPHLQKEKFDILSCARETVGYVKSLARKAGVEISVNSSKEKIIFYGRRVILMRAFFNLIENSLRYMNREGHIVMTVEETEEEVLVFYRDDGEGMEIEIAERIVELNYWGKDGESDGKGIGMFLVKKAVEENGGKLDIKTQKGKGMNVYMSFQKNF